MSEAEPLPSWARKILEKRKKRKPRKMVSKRKSTPLRNEFLVMTTEPQDPAPRPSLDAGFNWVDEQQRLLEENRLYQNIRAQGLELARKERALRKWKRKLQLLNNPIGVCLFFLIAIVFDRRSK
jgi:hypothetical protein